MDLINQGHTINILFLSPFYSINKIKSNEGLCPLFSTLKSELMLNDN